MSQEKRIPETKRRISSLCCVLGLQLSIVSCVALIHVELGIQEHHPLLSPPTTICNKMEEEILQQNSDRWADLVDLACVADLGDLNPKDPRVSTAPWDLKDQSG